MLLDLPIKKSSELKNWILQTIKVAVGSDAVRISEGIWQPYKLVLPVHSQELWLVLFLVRVILGEMDPCNLQNGLPLSTTISKMPSAIFRNSKFIYLSIVEAVWPLKQSIATCSSKNPPGLITQTSDNQEYQHTLFPTAIVLPSGLQHMLIFSPLVLTTDTHLLAVKGN